ncbi:MAG TPA: hypothetical protein VGN52_03030 [Burkholderiales bacterium]|jgi:hypothetical protein
MKFRVGLNAVPIWLALVGAPAWAGCAVEQTSSNEIIIHSSVGGCNGATLRENLASAVAGSDGVQAAAARPSAFSEVRRTSSQGALWRLANMNNMAAPTTLTMPGIR